MPAPGAPVYDSIGVFEQRKRSLEEVLLLAKMLAKNARLTAQAVLDGALGDCSLA